MSLSAVVTAAFACAPARAADPTPDAPAPVVDAKLERARALVARGQTLAAAKRMIDAAATLREAVDTYPDYPLAFHELGCVLADQGDFVAAQSALEKALALAPDFERAQQALGEVHRRAGHCDKALPHYAAAIGGNRRDIAAWYGLAACLINDKADKKANALWALERLLDATGGAESPLIEEARQTAAEFIRSGVKSEAWSLDGAPVAEDKKAAGADRLVSYSGDADFEAKRYIAALDAYRKDLATHGDDPALQYKIGATCAVLRDYRCAVAAFDKASGLAPGHPVIGRHLDLARAKLPVGGTAADAGKDPIQRAVEALRAGDAITTLVLVLGSDDPIAGYLEGEARLRLGDFNGAKAVFEEQLYNDVDDPIAKGGYAEALFRAGATGATEALTAWSGGETVPWDAFLVMRQREFKERVLSKRP